jgi:hypothetical protein
MRTRYKAKNRKLKMIIKDMGVRIGQIMSENEVLSRENGELRE